MASIGNTLKLRRKHQNLINIVLYRLAIIKGGYKRNINTTTFKMGRKKLNKIYLEENSRIRILMIIS